MYIPKNHIFELTINCNLKFMKNLFILFFFLWGVIANAQLNLDVFKKYLTNDDKPSNNSRIWVLGDYKTNLGKSCNGDGQSWEFFENGKVVIRQCINEQVIKKEFTYTIGEMENNSGEYIINFNKSVDLSSSISFKTMRIYLISPEFRKPNKIMKLNNVPDCKACKGEIIEFKSRN